ncbi:MAG: hypothetical protein EBT69_03925 [Verrucomicrobia bacterium]|nr:hypothetical protein [Verrucomicrobiota bacterium]
MNKKIVLLSLWFFLCVCAFANTPSPNPPESSTLSGIYGDWVGRLSEGMGSLKLVIHIRREESGPVATMDSPDQNGYGCPVSKIAVEGENLTFRIEPLDVTYEGKMDTPSGEIRGTFTQRGMKSPLVLKTMASQNAKNPSELNFTQGGNVPKDLRPSPGEGMCQIQIRNQTGHYVCMGWINSDGNLLHGWSNGEAGHTVSYVGPGCRTNPDFPYKSQVGSVFVILTMNGQILGFGKPSKPGSYDLILE